MEINNTQGSQNSAYALEPRVYEIGYHILPTVDEGDLEKEREALVAIITKLKGIVVSEELPALINLAYNMDKIIENKRNIFSQAYFGWIKFDLNQSLIEDFVSEVEEMKSVLRYLLIKTTRENTIISERPYKTIEKGRNNNQEEDIFIDTEELNKESVKEEMENVKESTFVEEIENKEIVEVEDNESVSAEDDLTKIEGVGPKIAEIFAENGIKNFEDLSSSKVGDLRKILDENKLASHDPKTWSKQATLAKHGKWDKLAELQDELKRGKEE